jgi:hypothetical protein
MVFQALKDELNYSPEEVPIKYIKFGEPTEYVFHTTINNIEESNVYLTPMFENYMAIRHITTNSFLQFFNNLKENAISFVAWQRIPKRKKLPIFM